MSSKRNNLDKPERKPQEVDQKYLNDHPGYKPGVWMRNPESLSNMGEEEKEHKVNETLTKETEDRIINEEIERYINDYQREKRQSIEHLKEKIDNDIRHRKNLLEEMRQREEEKIQPETSRKPDIEEERRKIEKMYQKIAEDELEKKRQLDKEREKMYEFIKKRFEEQERLFELKRREVEDEKKRLLDEERMKNVIEQNKLRDLKKLREELLKQELNELTQIEKHEKKKKLIEDELKRSIKERETEEERFAELMKKREELRQRELEELGRIQNQEEDVTRRRKELLDEGFKNRMPTDDIVEVWPCDGNDPTMCLVDPKDLCVDPFSGKLAIKGNYTPFNKNKSRDNEPSTSNGVRQNKINIDGRSPNGKRLLTKRKYQELLSTYDPKKLRRKLSYQNWLMNDSNMDDTQVAAKFPGSDFSMEIDVEDWPAIKQESKRQYAELKKTK